MKAEVLTIGDELLRGELPSGGESILFLRASMERSIYLLVDVDDGHAAVTCVSHERAVSTARKGDGGGLPADGNLGQHALGVEMSALR